MKRLCLVAALALMVSPAQAATYTYLGGFYDWIDYGNSSDDPDGYRLRGPYTDLMRVDIEVTFSALLPRHYTGGGGISVVSIRAFDGINRLSQRNGDIQVTTNARGAITGWVMRLSRGGGDNDFIYSSSVRGDEVGYYYEYAYWGDFEGDPDECCEQLFGSEDSYARAAIPGTWTSPVAQIAAVPLPAGVWLFATGLAGLATLRRLGRRPA